jgi:hypothetical protein
MSPMTSDETSLPAGFESLEPFVPAWAIHGAAARARRRLDSTPAERVAFFEAAKDLAQPALARLDQTPLARHDAAETRLMELMLSFAHVALAVETQGDDEPTHALNARNMRITRAPSDAAA